MSENEEQEYHPEENQENENHNQELLNREINKQNIQEDSSKKLTSGHEIISEEENKKYFLQFINKNELIKILLIEKDIFPYKTYELLTSLEELQPKNIFFANFTSAQELVDELNNPNSTINFSIIKKQANVLELFFVFPIEGEDNSMEIELTANNINNREMFRQLFEKYQSIKQEQEEDVAQLKNRMNAIEEILVNMQKEQEAQKEQERLEKERLEKEAMEKEAMENEEHNEEQQQNNEKEQEIDEVNSKKDLGGKKKDKKEQINEIKSSNTASKRSIQKEKEKEKNIKKGKPEKKKQEKNVNNHKKKIK